MVDGNKIIGTFYRAYKTIRKVKIKRTGMAMTRLIAGLLLAPAVTVSITYIGSFSKGYLSNGAILFIEKGIYIIDHVFTPSVLAFIIGILTLFIDTNHDGIADALEKKEEKQGLPTGRGGRREGNDDYRR